jgi:hypothetical protein
VPTEINIGPLPPGYDPDTHCSACENPIPPTKVAIYTCEETGAKQCSWECRVTWLEILARSKDLN